MLPSIRSSTRTPVRALVALGVLAVPALFTACGLLDTAEELKDKAQANKMLAASVLGLPDYEMAGTIDSFTDGGLSDAGEEAIFGDGGMPTKIPGQTQAQVFFGERNLKDPAKPGGIAGAKVKLSFAGKSFNLKDNGSGDYSLSTQDDETLVYASGADYTLSVVHGGQTYEATVKGPAVQKIAEFHATPGKPIEVQVDRELKLTRSDAEDIAFTTVFPLSAGEKGAPTYSDFPGDALSLFELVANDAKWRTPQITIPGAPPGPAGFPKADTNHLITVTSVKRGETSSNLFLGSTLLVGGADIGLAKTP